MISRSVSAQPGDASTSLTPFQKKVWLLSALGIFMDGFDLFILAVALPLILTQFSASPLMIGTLGAAAVFGAMFGAILGGRGADRFGRKLLFKIDMGVFLVGALLSAFAPSLGFLIFARFLLGIGVGADYPIAASYIAEFMPAAMRGRRLVGAFAFQAVGMLVGALLGIGLLITFKSDWVWRLMLGAGTIPALVILVFRRGMPESERWERAGAAEVSPSVRDLFSRVLRRKTVLATVPWFLMDICLYGVGVFTPTILAILNLTGQTSVIRKDIASSEGAAFLDLFLIVGFGLAIWLVDRAGRIRLQIIGFAGCAVGLALLTGLTFTNSCGPLKALVFLGFAIFNLSVNAGPNSATFLLAAELYPTSVRATGHGFASATGKLGAAFGILLLPLLITSIGLGWTMAILTLAALAGLIVTTVFGVETRGDLDQAEAVA